jgi:hypothetical protein
VVLLFFVLCASLSEKAPARKPQVLNTLNGLPSDVVMFFIVAFIPGRRFLDRWTSGIYLISFRF